MGRAAPSWAGTPVPNWAAIPQTIGTARCKADTSCFCSIGLRLRRHRTYVGGVERGEYNVTILTLRRFTKALGITIQDAIRGIA